MVAADSDDWYYLDRTGAEFGPFRTEKMRAWFRAGFFPIGDELMVRLSGWSRHQRLYMLYADKDSIFNGPPKLSGPAGPSSAPSLSVSRTRAAGRSRSRSARVQLEPRKAVEERRQARRQHVADAAPREPAPAPPAAAAVPSTAKPSSAPAYSSESRPRSRERAPSAGGVPSQQPPPAAASAAASAAAYAAPAAPTAAAAPPAHSSPPPVQQPPAYGQSPYGQPPVAPGPGPTAAPQHHAVLPSPAEPQPPPGYAAHPAACHPQAYQAVPPQPPVAVAYGAPAGYGPLPSASSRQPPPSYPVAAPVVYVHPAPPPYGWPQQSTPGLGYGPLAGGGFPSRAPVPGHPAVAVAAYPAMPYSMPPAQVPGYGPLRPPAPKGRLMGRLKSFNEKTGFGFLENKEIYTQYGRDVFIHKQHVKGFDIGDKVTFSVELNKEGFPQARNVKKADSSLPGDAARRDESGPGRKARRRRGRKKKPANAAAAGDRANGAADGDGDAPAAAEEDGAEGEDGGGDELEDGDDEGFVADEASAEVG